VCVMDPRDVVCGVGATKSGLGTSAVTRFLCPYHSASYLPLLEISRHIKIWAILAIEKWGGGHHHGVEHGT